MLIYVGTNVPRMLVSEFTEPNKDLTDPTADDKCIIVIVEGETKRRVR